MITSIIVTHKKMEQRQLSVEEQKDVLERSKAFEKDYEDLMKKYEVYHSIFPQYVPVAPGIFATISNATIVDKKYQSVASPYKDKIVEE
jgi:hypothetical protein